MALPYGGRVKKNEFNVVPDRYKILREERENLKYKILVSNFRNKKLPVQYIKFLYRYE